LAQTGSAGRLPPGHYTYLDSDPPAKFNVKDDGSILWSNAAKPSKPAARSSNAHKPPSLRATVATSRYQWDRKNNTLIEWKAHPVTTIPSGEAKLSTDYQEGSLKYKLTLSKVQKMPYWLYLQLLDANGFQLTEVSIFGSDFHPVPGTELLEATGTSLLNETDYRRAADYLVR
jgi:hypothetical protein